ALAPRDQQTEVGLRRAKRPSRLEDRATQVRDLWQLQGDGLRRRREAGQVKLQVDDLAVHRANAFEDAVSVEQAVIQHRDFRVVLLDQSTVHPKRLHASPSSSFASCWLALLTAEVKLAAPSSRKRGATQATMTAPSSRSAKNTGAAIA